MLQQMHNIIKRDNAVPSISLKNVFINLKNVRNYMCTQDTRI